MKISTTSTIFVGFLAVSIVIAIQMTLYLVLANQFAFFSPFYFYFIIGWVFFSFKIVYPILSKWLFGNRLGDAKLKNDETDEKKKIAIGVFPAFFGVFLFSFAFLIFLSYTFQTDELEKYGIQQKTVIESKNKYQYRGTIFQLKCHFDYQNQILKPEFEVDSLKYESLKVGDTINLLVSTRDIEICALE